ncbi:MAG: radical SAM protein [Pseudomonadota bacterium]
MTTSPLTSMRDRLNNADRALLANVPDRYLTPVKLENFILARNEERRKKTVLTAAPYHLVVEPTNACNLRCPLCPTGSGVASRKTGRMSMAKFKNLVAALETTTIELYLQNWGESTLLPDLPEMIRYSAGMGLWTHLSSNFSIRYPSGYLEDLVTSGLSFLTVDVDGLSQDVYECYRRGGRLARVIENLRSAVQVKRSRGLSEPQITATMIAMRHNEHQLADFADFCGQLGVDAGSVGKLQINPNVTASWLPENPDHVYRTYRGGVQSAPCHWPWSGLVINWDGGVSPCCIIEDCRADFGNVFQTPLHELWNNTCFQSARAQFAAPAATLPRTICNLCKNDTHHPRLPRAGDTFAITL